MVYQFRFHAFVNSLHLLIHDWCPVFHPTAAGSPTNVLARPTGATGFTVSWTAPTTGATVTGYRVYYNGGTDQGSTDVVASDTTVTISNHTWDLTHTDSIKIVALSNHLQSSPVVGTWMATFGK